MGKKGIILRTYYLKNFDNLLSIQMEEGINDIKVKVMQLLTIRGTCRFMECKICKDIPTPLGYVLQTVGCQGCLDSCIDTSGSCPLCRAAMPELVHVHGLYGLLQCLTDYVRNLRA